MTRKRFNKLMMGLGIPRNQLTKKLKAGDEYKNLLYLMHCFALLDDENDAVQKATAVMSMKMISAGKLKKCGDAILVQNKYLNEKRPWKVAIMSSNAVRFLDKYAGLVEACEKSARELIGSQN